MVTIAYDLQYPTPYHWDIFGHILLLHTCWQSVQGHFVVVVVFPMFAIVMGLVKWNWNPSFYFVIISFN